VLISLQMLPLPLHYSWKWMLSFLVGSCAFLLRDRIVFFFPLAVTAFVLDLGLIRFLPKAGKPAFPLLLFYLLLVVGFHPRLYMRWFERIGDLSYGLYIYAWPIQQMWAGRIHSPWKLFVVSYACVLPVASLSWHLLESRCLAWKGRRTEAAADASGVRVAW
jgi:peptidoglycan/LPS O-acetylase OafA/YrhL